MSVPNLSFLACQEVARLVRLAKLARFVNICYTWHVCSTQHLCGWSRGMLEMNVVPQDTRVPTVDGIAQ